MSLFNIWSLSDLLDLQAKLASDATSTNQSVIACTSLDAASRANWQAFYLQVQAFTAQTPVWLFPTASNEVLGSGTRVDETQALQRSLYAWQQKLSTTCALSAPLVAPGTPDGPSAGTVDALKYVAITAGFLGTAYVVARVAALLPSAREREARSARRQKAFRHI
jgi:hypothetical protein